MRLLIDINSYDAVLEILTSYSQGNRLEQLSEEEYQTFVSRLTEANFLEKRIIEYKEEIQRMEDYVKDYRTNIVYLKGSLEKQQLQMTKVLTQISERNVIEAKEKDVLR